MLAALMAVNYTLKNSPWINLLCWVPNYLKDFAKHVLPPGANVKNFTEAEKQYNKNYNSRTTKWTSGHTQMRTNSVKFAYHMLCDYSPTDAECSYLSIKPEEIDVTRFNLPAKYVTIQGAYVERVKTMPAETFNKIVEFVRNKGYEPVFLGKTANDVGTNNLKILAQVEKQYKLDGINLIDKTNLLESAKIIHDSKLLICMDGGLLHLAGFSKTPVVSGFTFVTPQQIMPIRDGIVGKDIYPVEPDESLACRGCQSNFNLLYGHDFRNCYYTDYACVSQMTAVKFIKEIEKVLK